MELEPRVEVGVGVGVWVGWSAGVGQAEASRAHLAVADALVVGGPHAQVRHDGGEGVVGDLRLRLRRGGEERALA